MGPFTSMFGASGSFLIKEIMSETNGNRMSPADLYRKLAAGLERRIIEVEAPSGFVFKRYEPTREAVLFQDGSLPQDEVEGVLDAWKADGLKTEGDEEAPAPQFSSRKEAQDYARAIAVRDRVISNSVEPKLVMGRAAKDGELHVDELHPDDIAFLYKYEATGGDKAVMARMFLGESPKRPLASASRKKRKTASV